MTPSVLQEEQAEQQVTLPVGLRSLDLPLYAHPDGRFSLGPLPPNAAIAALAPPCPLHLLGDPSFLNDHGLRFPCYSGAMANGIGSEDIVEAMGNVGMLGFFGAAGLSPARISQALERLAVSMKDRPWGANLINSPGDPLWQEAVAKLYIEHKVPVVEASAYVSLSLPLIQYRVHGLYRDATGRVVAPNRVVAKVSRVEVAQRFFSPPPEKMLAKLVEAGHISADQAQMAAEIPVAQDVTMEADSGGHTDHRPAITALPAMLALRDQMQLQYGDQLRLRVGLAGGIATPWSAAAAFTMGADYVVTGSVNQACLESGSSDLVREMLAQASQTDVDVAPAADMFEMGVTVQVLKKGTRFTIRGAKLFELYKAYGSIDELPEQERAKIEKEIFRKPLEEVWAETRAFFEERDPRQIQKAEENPRHKMALLFRWYLGQSSGWANRGVPDRQEDYQIWCGPAMGAFNEWVKGSWLEPVQNRRVARVAQAILAGAAQVLRYQSLRRQGIAAGAHATLFAPMSEQELEEKFS